MGPKLLQPAAVSSLPQPRAILFDLDGTLVDTMTIFADVAAKVMVRRHGFPFDYARRRYLETSGIPFFEQLEVIAPRHDANATASAEFEEEKLVATTHVVPDADTLAALARLREAGIGVAVSSNNFQDQVDRFAAGCPVPLDLALGFGNGLAKGESHFEHACRRFACGRADLVFVGDSLNDAALAKQGQVRFVARLGTFGAARFRKAAPEAGQVRRLTELPRLFAR